MRISLDTLHTITKYLTFGKILLIYQLNKHISQNYYVYRIYETGKKDVYLRQTILNQEKYKKLKILNANISKDADLNHLTHLTHLNFGTEYKRMHRTTINKKFNKFKETKNANVRPRHRNIKHTAKLKKTGIFGVYSTDYVLHTL